MPSRPSATSERSSLVIEKRRTLDGSTSTSSRSAGVNVASAVTRRSETRETLSEVLATTTWGSSTPSGTPSSSCEVAGSRWPLRYSLVVSPRPIGTNASMTVAASRPRSVVTRSASSSRLGISAPRSSRTVAPPATETPRRRPPAPTGPDWPRTVMVAVAGPASGLCSSSTEVCSAPAPTPVNHWSLLVAGQSTARRPGVDHRWTTSPGAVAPAPLTRVASASSTRRSGMTSTVRGSLARPPATACTSPVSPASTASEATNTPPASLPVGQTSTLRASGTSLGARSTESTCTSASASRAAQIATIGTTAVTTASGPGREDEGRVTEGHLICGSPRSCWRPA